MKSGPPAIVWRNVGLRSVSPATSCVFNRVHGIGVAACLASLWSYVWPRPDWSKQVAYANRGGHRVPPLKCISNFESLSSPRRVSEFAKTIQPVGVRRDDGLLFDH